MSGKTPCYTSVLRPELSLQSDQLVNVVPRLKCKQGSSLALKAVTIFVPRRGWNGKEGTGMYRPNGTLQDFGIAN